MDQLSKRINEIRLRKGMSQEQLSDLSGLNLRTIQRIEKGDTIPRGDSIQRLSKALESSPDELIGWEAKEDKSVLIMLNLSQLAFLIFPLLGILIPMGIWIFQKDKINKVNNVGKSILNFQMTWSLMFFLFSGPIIYLGITLLPGDIFFFGTVFLYLYNILLIVISTIRLTKEKKVFYQPTIPFLKR